MKLQQRDKRALLLLAGAIVLVLILWVATTEETAPQVVAPADNAALAEKRLAKLRHLVASLPDREKALESVSANLAEREKGMIQAETPAQAQAQVLQILRRVASSQAPPVELKTVDMGQIQPLGEHYGEISLAVAFECRIEQLLNFVADLSAQPELLATREMRITAADDKQKTINVRLTVSAAAPGRLVPGKKGVPAS